MIKHIMSDGSVRDSIDGYVLSKKLSEDILKIFANQKGRETSAKSKTRTIKKK